MDPPSGRIRREPPPEVGLTVIFEPDLPSLDIVFVHGFTGSPDKTWTHRGGNTGHRTDDRDEPPPKVRKLQPPFQSRSNADKSTPPVFWPRDLLPSTIPHARVLTYGYDTHLRHKLIGRPVSKLTLYDIAKGLLVSIEAGRRDEPSRPVLFVCHSLGGVVVKEMLRQASHCQDADLHMVSESTIGIMFFGTPHSGADPRELLHHVAEKLFRLAGLCVNEQIVSALLPTSERLRQLRDEFNPIAEKQGWGIYSFQEAYGVRMLGGNRVVEDMSSSLGLGPLETTQHINADHMEMCRFAGLEDSEYLNVAAALRRMTIRTTPRSKEDERSHEVPQPLNDAQRDALLQSLRFRQIDSRLGSVKAAHAKTCSWFLDSNEYLEWLDARKLNDHHGFLWIKGKPGAGKSTLMKFVFNKSRKKIRNSVSFFFNARGAELERTVLGMYRSLLLQLLEPRPYLRHAFDAAEIATWNATSDYVWCIESLKRVFEEVVHLLDPSDPVACFIDALDECPENEIRDMVEFFEGLGDYAVSNQIKFRVLFSSRHYPHITISKGLDMVLEKQNEHTEDIKKYVESRLKIKAKNVEFRDEILARIQEKASGVFMWVVLVVDMLKKSQDGGRPSAYIRKELEDLPGDLSDLFRDILMRDPHHKTELLLCLQWILFARRPLMPDELYCAINTGTETESLAKWDLDDDQVERFILNSSKGLAEIVKTKSKAKSKVKDEPETEAKAKMENKTVQFIHESVRDFLLKEGGLRVLWPHLGDAFEAQSHDRLKDCCLTYINMPDAHELARRLEFAAKVADVAKEELPFLEYATQSVLFHADAAAVGGINQDDFLHNFPRPHWLSLHNTFERYQARHYSPTVTLPYVLAENNLAALVRAQLSANGQTGLEVERQRFGTPLFAALATQSRKAALAILETIAQAEPSVPKLQNLCEKFGQNEASRRWGRSSHFTKELGVLWHALQQGDDFIALFLVSLSPKTRTSLFDTEKTDETGKTPLTYAARGGWDSVVRGLVEAGANIEADDRNGMTPIMHAALVGSEPVFRALLEAGARTDGWDRNYQTLLIHAAARSTRFVIKVILEAGANLEAEDIHGRTALSYAAAYGNDSVVDALIEAGSLIEAKDKHGRTPLSRAAGKGQGNTVLALIARGAKVEAKDRTGRTPLSWAAGQGQEDTVLALIARGAKVEAKDRTGRTPLSWAAGEGQGNTVLALIARGAEFEAKDRNGRTPLSWAAAHESEDVVSAVITSGAEIDVDDGDGRTPLSRAVSGYGSVDRIIRALIENVAQIETRDKDGRTPLHWAAQLGKRHWVEILREKGARVDTKDTYGRTPLDLAAAYGHHDVVELLRSAAQ